MSTPTHLNLIRLLMKITLDADQPGQADQLSSATAGVWKNTLKVLGQNNITAIVYGRIEARGLVDLLPPNVRSRMQKMHTRAVARNHTRMTLFADVLERLAKEGIEPILLKSAALVALFPDRMLGHEMSDVDLYVLREDMEKLELVMCDAGLACPEITPSAVYFDHHSGNLKLDIHYRFEIFEKHDISSLLTHVESRLEPLKTLRVFKPNARLVHLLWHLNDHRWPHGYQLRWILDLGLVFREWQDDFDLEQMRRLMPSSVGNLWLVRLANFYEHELGLKVLENIIKPNNGVPPLTLEEMLRSQRVACWPLTHVRGWRKLVACRLGLRPIDRRIYPKLTDLPLYLGDVRREEQAAESFTSAQGFRS
jgi:hypothetical protein